MAAEKTETAQDKATPVAANSSNGKRIRIIGIIVGVIVVIGLVVWLRSRGHESTDDAEVDGRITQIAARVSGPVLKIPVDNNQKVAAGDLLVQIDPRDYQVAVDRAEAELADAQANAAASSTSVPIAQVETRAGVTNAAGGLDQAQAGVSGAEHEVQAAQANLVAAQAHQREKEATATKAAKDVERLKPLVEKDEISKQQYDAAVSTADAARAVADAARSDVAAAQTAIGVAQQRVASARATAEQARAGLETAKTAPQQLKVTQAKAAAAEARVRQAESALAQAKLNLEYTTIKAPTAGVVSRKMIELGQVIQQNQPLMALVNLDDIWITANYKETQLKAMQAGQAADVDVDGLGRTFKGHVDSIAAATGARFSLLPPENASGNYVKVVQRVPVKIVLEAGQDPNHLLRPGMSVTPTVYVK